jgi:hypothetical protein
VSLRLHDFIKKYRATLPSFNSGGDNEPFSDNLCAFEDLDDLHESFKMRQPKKKASAADARARDCAEDNVIRGASLGLFVASQEGGGSEQKDDNNKENDNPPATAAATSTQKNSSSQFRFCSCWMPQRWQR